MSNKMKNMRAALLFCLVAVISLSVSAQNVTVKGTVTDKTGETVIGASVVQKGNTGTGTITDIDGNFTLSVPAHSTLVFSYVGMKTQEVALNGKTVINVTMEDDSQALEEVVVIGYGTVQKKDLTVPSSWSPYLYPVLPKPCKGKWPVYRLQRPKVHQMQKSRFVCAVAVLCHRTTHRSIS